MHCFGNAVFCRRRNSSRKNGSKHEDRIFCVSRSASDNRNGEVSCGDESSSALEETWYAYTYSFTFLKNKFFIRLICFLFVSLSCLVFNLSEVVLYLYVPDNHQTHFMLKTFLSTTFISFVIRSSCIWSEILFHHINLLLPIFVTGNWYY